TTSGSIPFGTSPSVGDTQPDGGAVGTCVSNNASSTWAAHTSYVDGTYAGAYPWTGTATIDGTIYPAGQFLPDWHTGKFVVAIAGGQPCLFEAQRNMPGANVPSGVTSPVDVPISVTYGGGTSGHIGWTMQYTSPSGANNHVANLTYGG